MRLSPSPAHAQQSTHSSGETSTRGWGPTLSPAEMGVLQTHQKTPELSATYMVAVEVRRSDAIKTTDADFGVSIRPYAETLLLIGEYLLHLRESYECSVVNQSCNRSS